MKPSRDTAVDFFMFVLLCVVKELFVVVRGGGRWFLKGVITS